MRRAAAAALLLAACRTTPPGAGATTWIVVGAPPDSGVDLAAARVEGRGVRRASFTDSHLAVEVSAHEASEIVIRAEGGCTLRVSKHEWSANRTVHRSMMPWFDFGGPRAQAGFGAPLEIVARPGCAEANRAPITWQTSGVALRELSTSPDGHRLTATFPSLEELFGTALPWGIVPISPRTRGEAALEASWKDDEGRRVTRTLRASAAARSRGLPNVTVGTRLHLGGEGWHVVSSPPSARAGIELEADHAMLTPDARGTWVLEDRAGAALRLVAGKYDETPLDCGRSDCHAAIATSALSNPMSTILERGIDAPFGGDYPACALGCHATGEPGLDDGGFEAVAHALGHGVRDATRNGFHELAPSLRRLGGVGCLACHGPGAIPEAGARSGILRADVCATCHDAPPRYGHVVAWRTSRMARADADPRTSDGACARCHTTWGFLGQQARKPPPGSAPVGIACAACHAVHPVRTETGGVVIGRTCAEALRRDLIVPGLLEGAVPATADRGRACLSCHSPGGDDGAPSAGTPSASAAAIWAGRGGLDPSSGAPIVGPAPHGAVDGGCIGCHRTGPAGLGHGEGHAFQANRDACGTCHADKHAETAETLRDRALALLSATHLLTGGLAPRGFASRTAPPAAFAGSLRSRRSADGSPLHAERRRFDLRTPLGRAAWNAAMVLEDPAAAAHNAPYARALLDAAARAVAPSAPNGGKAP